MATHGTAITPAWYQLESIQMCVISAQLSKESAPCPPSYFMCELQPQFQKSWDGATKAGRVRRTKQRQSEISELIRSDMVGYKDISTLLESTQLSVYFLFFCV